MSHNGAIRCRTPEDPQHFKCPDTSLKYFDPGNWVYALALTVLCPESCKRQNWNIGTKGDIIEGLMGCAYLKHHSIRHTPLGGIDPVKYADESDRVADMLDEVSWRTNALSMRVGYDKLLPWVQWVVANIDFVQLGIWRPSMFVENASDKPLAILDDMKDRGDGFLVPLHLIAD